jgi:hypothetical protein
MSDDLEKVIMGMAEDIKEIKKYIPTTDIVTNEQYCEYRTANGAKLKVRGLLEWFDKGCPREDSRHVSKKAVDDWAKENNTRKPKKK